VDLPGAEPGEEGHQRPEEPDDELPGRRLKAEEADADDPIELLQPKVDPVERVLWSTNRKTGERVERTYVQRPIATFPKIELYGILGRAVKIVLEADTGVDVATLMDMANPRRVLDQLTARLPGAEDAPLVEGSNEREMDAMRIMAAFAEVVSVAPELLREAYCVILNIPPAHREWAKNHALDNVDDDEWFDVLETFIDQSWGAIEGFFTQHLPRAARRTIQARQRAEEKRRSSGTR
jgi:hypothetical protein